MKKIELVFPVVKVTVEDISNMQTILLGSKCAVPEKGLARLRAMGLSRIEKLPPCPKLIAEWETKEAEAESMLRSAVGRKSIDWDLVGKSSNKHPGKWNKPKERFRDVITKAGVELLEKGNAMVEIQQSC